MSAKFAGTMPNSTAVLPRTRRRHRITGWSAVDLSEMRSLGPMPLRRINRPASGVGGMRPKPASWHQALSKPQPASSSRYKRSFHEMCLQRGENVGWAFRMKANQFNETNNVCSQTEAEKHS